MSRLTLAWFNLTQQAGQDLCLKIPICEVYSRVIDRAFHALSHIGWRDSERGTGYTYFKHITDEQRDRLNAFLELLQSTLCLTISPHLQPSFTNELDEAYALDFTFQQGVQPLTYTDPGKLQHEAKDLRIASAANALATVATEVIRGHPTLLRADIIAAMPRRPSKPYHLPEHLLSEIGAILKRPVGLRLFKTDHPKLRDLSLPQKLEALKTVFRLEESVQGKSVLIIDDLYQSGASVWSLAGFLKSNGAREVYALACVKSWSDTDNV